MSASLVGSEMCIRDSPGPHRYPATGPPGFHPSARVPPRCPRCRSRPVSYTHLTLPTICSV
eukprot:9552041-Alexandrium_andersonii.AAC.1